MRKYVLCYYPSEAKGTSPMVEMIDLKMRRTFLKKTPISVEELKLSDMHIGALVNVYSRQLKVVAYGNDFTRDALGAQMESTLMMVKPDAQGNAGEILDMVISAGLQVKGLRMTKLLRKDAEEFYGEHRGQHFFDKLVTFMSSGPVIALEVVGKGAIGAVRQLNGPTDSTRARSEAPSSIRAKFGKDGTVNAVHASDSPASAAREISFFFTEKKGNPTATLSGDSTLCLVKPHALESAGAIWQAIASAGFTVTAARTFALDRVAASEFLEVYKGVVPEYVGMVTEFTKGNTLALELTGGGAQPEFRKFAGPRDPEIARHLRPGSLRANFGVNKIQNAVHCTDLPEDGPLELEYFFAILVNSGHH